MGYRFIFGVGTIAGMMLITAAIALPVSYALRFQLLHRNRGRFSQPRIGFVSRIQIGFIDGLFTK